MKLAIFIFGLALGACAQSLDPRTEEELFRKTVLAELRVQRAALEEAAVRDKALRHEVSELRLALMRLGAPRPARLSDF
jgi:hypothetical protein